MTPFLSPVIFTISFFVNRFSTSKNSIICHNVLPHEKRIFDKFLSKLVFSQMDEFIVHASEEKNDLLNYFGIKKPIKIGYHPKYDFFKNNRHIIDIRKKYNIENKIVLLYFGYIREYKGLKFLLEALKKLIKTDKNFHLLIVGEFWDPIREYEERITKLDITKNVTIINEYVPDNEVGNYFDSCDFVVLPYISATQSGIAQIAIVFGKPVVITNVGGLKDLGENDLCYLISPSSSKEIVDAVLELSSNNKNVLKLPISGNTGKSWESYIQLILQ